MKSPSKKEKKNNAATAAFWYLISNFIVKGFGFITTPIFTRVMNTEEYGIVSIYNSYSAVISVIVTLDLYACIQISKKDYRQDNDAFVSSIMFLSSVSIVFFYSLLKIYVILSGDSFDLPAYMLDAMFLSIFFENAFNIRQTYLRSHTKYKEFSICTLAFSVFSVALGLLFVTNMNHDKYWGRVYGGIIPMIAVGLYAMIRTYSRGRCLIKKSYWKYGLSFSLPLIVHHISGKVLSSFDRIMINVICGTSYVAIYSLAYSIGAIIEIIWFSFNNAWTPWFYDRLEENNLDAIKKAVRPYTLTFCLFIFAAILAGPDVIKILGPEEYWEGKWIVPPVAFGFLFQFVYSLYVNIEMFNKKTKNVAIGTVCAALLNIVLNYIFIPMFGYIAAAYTTLFGYGVLFMFHYIIAGRIDNRDLFGRKFIFCIIVTTCVCSIIMTALYQTIIVRYVVIIALGLFGFLKYRNLIMKVIKKKI